MQCTLAENMRDRGNLLHRPSTARSDRPFHPGSSNDSYSVFGLQSQVDVLQPDEKKCPPDCVKSVGHKARADLPDEQTYLMLDCRSKHWTLEHWTLEHVVASLRDQLSPTRHVRISYP